MSVPTSAVAQSLSDVVGSVRQRISRARKSIYYQLIKLSPSFVIAYALEIRRRAARSGGIFLAFSINEKTAVQDFAIKILAHEDVNVDIEESCIE
jgi:hypothetical protein